MAALRIALGEVATRDFLRSELRDLVEEVEPGWSSSSGPAAGRRAAGGGGPRAPHVASVTMTSPPTTVPTDDLVMAALATVDDPEIRRPITELDMVRSVRIDPDGAVAVEVLLTVAGCPMRDEITRRVTGAVSQGPRRDRGRGRPGRDVRRAAPRA